MSDAKMAQAEARKLIQAEETKRIRGATALRELVRHLGNDQHAFALLARLLQVVAVELLPHVPPPPAPREAA